MASSSVPASPPKSRRLAWLLLFPAAFLLLDRLVFLGLRAALERHAFAKAVQGMRVPTPIGNGDTDVVIMGTSRARKGFDRPQIATTLRTRVLSEARAGKYPKHYYYFYRTLKRARGVPAAVLYGVDYFMFVNVSKPLAWPYPDETARRRLLNPQSGVNPASPLLGRVSWLFRLKREIDELVGGALGFQAADADEDVDGPDDAAPEPEAADKAGLPPAAGRGAAPGSAAIAAPAAGGTPASAPPEPEAAPVRRERKPATAPVEGWRKRTYEPYPGVEGEYFRKLLQELQADGVPTYLVLLPEFIGSYETNFEQARFRADLARIAAEFPVARVVDLDDPAVFDLSDRRLFIDGGWGQSNSHLTYEGARLATRLLLKRMRALRAAPAAGGKEAGR